MTEVKELHAKALAEERARNAGQLARFRFVAAIAVTLLNLYFVATLPGFIGAPPIGMLVYTLAAGLLLLLEQRFDLLRRWNGMSIPLMDMPIVYFFINATVTGLRENNNLIDAAAMSGMLPLFYIHLIFLASLLLRAPHTWIATLTALVLQSIFLTQNGRDISFISMNGLATVMATGICLYSRQRSLALVGNAALEQSKRSRLNRYFSPNVAEHLAESDNAFGRGEKCEVSVLFADIRNFTALSETISPDSVVLMLNRFHDAMVGEVFAHGGTLDKYLGDGLMAYFGAPVSNPDHATLALRCALGMQAALARLNDTLEGEGHSRLRMGIGIHSGPVILGDIGTMERREFTIIGDTVNVAARIEEATKTYQAEILISATTAAQVDNSARLVSAGFADLRGKRSRLELFRIAGEG